MKNFNPRHLRKGYRKSHSDDDAKKKAFRKVARWSKRFIHLSADQLAKPRIAPHYAEWCAKSRKGTGLR